MIVKPPNLLFAYNLLVTHTRWVTCTSIKAPIPTFFSTLNPLSPNPGLEGREGYPSYLLDLSGSGDPMFVNTAVSCTSAPLLSLTINNLVLSFSRPVGGNWR